MPLLSQPRGRASTRDRTAAALLDAAERLLEGGAAFADLPVERIAVAAGVARSTFYMHFRDRRALLLALAERSFAPLEDRVEALRDAGHAPDRARIRRGIAAALALARTNAPVVRAVAEAAAYDEEVRRHRDDLERRCADAVAERMHRARGRPAPPAVTRVLVIAVAESLVRQVSAPPAQTDAELVGALTEVWWQAAYAKRG